MKVTRDYLKKLIKEELTQQMPQMEEESAPSIDQLKKEIVDIAIQNRYSNHDVNRLRDSLYGIKDMKMIQDMHKAMMTIKK